ncbi:DUF134 domain-containing protein [Sansalvadorimonas sp. 2012CJ34-2]|uniref:UPF0251 protein M3P05_14685 n=1 Tax=Parendozoicomonas callyspongiae TaxID=2942213 RepID=A0ABT0PIJ0_9GAMM|nr:DUF134 domain-containing protein [Sansalvadorimonas sp. 2012CJ34-2]MCL6271170.1 DUF134 domain-containing protein [Sansalvadorimonas sp. 2012CJ34-2]
MPRPKLPRRICGHPARSCFKPNGIPMGELEKVWLDDDEFEALRLVDLEGMQQQEAAKEMGVSRQTLANVLKSARHKVTECIASGKALMMNRKDEETTENDHCSSC